MPPRRCIGGSQHTKCHCCGFKKTKWPHRICSQSKSKKNTAHLIWKSFSRADPPARRAALPGRHTTSLCLEKLKCAFHCIQQETKHSVGLTVFVMNPPCQPRLWRFFQKAAIMPSRWGKTPTRRTAWGLRILKQAVAASSKWDNGRRFALVGIADRRVGSCTFVYNFSLSWFQVENNKMRSKIPKQVINLGCL